MLPVIEEFVRKYDLEDFIVVADSGLMTAANIAELEQLGYKYIIGARIKGESDSVKKLILSMPKINGQMHEIDKGGGRRLLVGYTDDRARKDSYNRNKGVRRLERLYKRGRLTKESINKRGYNKFLDMSGDTTVVINRERISQDSAWDGLKGYLTNTDIPERRAGVPHCKVENRDTPHVPLHTQAHRGARLHLLRGLEVLQRT